MKAKFQNLIFVIPAMLLTSTLVIAQDSTNDDWRNNNITGSQNELDRTAITTTGDAAAKITFGNGTGSIGTCGLNAQSVPLTTAKGSQVGLHAKTSADFVGQAGNGRASIGYSKSFVADGAFIGVYGVGEASALNTFDSTSPFSRSLGGFFSGGAETGTTLDIGGDKAYVGGSYNVLTGDINGTPQRGAVAAVIGIDESTGTAPSYAGYFVGNQNYMSGNLGIGTDTPTEKLEVHGNVKVDGTIEVQGDTQSVSTVRRLNGSDYLSTSEEYCYRRNGRRRYCHIVSTNAILNPDDQSYAKPSATYSSWADFYQTTETGDDFYDISFSPPGEDITWQSRFHIDAQGNTGVGTNTPLGKLHVNDGNFLLENGRIGIGVTAPARPFHMRASNTVFRLDRDSNSPGFIMARFPSGDYSGDALESFSMIVNGYENGDPGYLALTNFNGKVGGASDRVFLVSNTGSLIVDNATAQDPNAVVESDYRLHIQGDAFKSDGGDLWNVLSDKRLKRNIKKYEGGLDIIKKLNPVTYEYNGKAGTKAGSEHIGVVAQELQKVAPHMVSTFHVTTADDGGIEYIDGRPDGMEVTRTKHEYLSINASSLKWMMVDAIQEQQDIIETQKDEIATMREEMSEMKEMMQAILNGQNTDINRQDIRLNGSGAYLEQNQPNPFNTNTLIKYHVPTDATNVVVNIFNEKGQLIHSERIVQMGAGQIQVKAGTISAGTYSYSLVVNGKITDTKRMVIVK